MENKNKQNSKSNSSRPLKINPKFLNSLLFIIVGVLAVISLSGQYLKYNTEYDAAFGLIPLFNIDGELSIPAIFSVLLLFTAAILLFIIATIKRKNKERYVAAWMALSIGFLFMTFDEGATIHEKLMPIMHSFLGDDLPSIFYFPWVIPAIAGLIVIAPFFTKFIIDLPKKTRQNFLLAGAIYVGGAIGTELVSGYYAGIFGMKNFGFNIVATIEEILEMSGLIIFNKALLTYIGEETGILQFSIENKSKPKKQS